MIILTDNREQQPWDLTPYGYEQEFTTVKTGDYTVKGMEDQFSVERKSSAGELAINFGKKWKSFARELHRMDEIPQRYIICEFPLSHIYDFPYNSGIPRSKWKYLKITSSFLSRRIEEIVAEFNTPILFSTCRSDAERKFVGLLNDL